VHAPNPWQQFKLWRDFGGQNPGPFARLSKYNQFTGERRIAYINHNFLGTLELLSCMATFVVLALSGITNQKIYIGFGITFLAIGAVHIIVMFVRRETFMQLQWREHKAAEQASEANLEDLVQFAEKTRKGYSR
jgi:hypothetical protein